MGVEVVIDGLTKTFGSHVVWSDVSLTLPAGEVSVMLGPSGTGKTVFLKSLVGLITPTTRQKAGSVAIGSGGMIAVPHEFASPNSRAIASGAPRGGPAGCLKGPAVTVSAMVTEASGSASLPMLSQVAAANAIGPPKSMHKSASRLLKFKVLF